MAGSEEFPVEVEIFEDVHDSQFIRPMRMKFKRGDKLIKWDLILRHDSVACLLYHKQKHSLLFVKQFRPAVYISRVRRLDENVNKKWNEINWSKYPISMGETIELCAGLIDKSNISWRKHIQEEINEECGYKKENFVIVHGRNIEKCKATIDYIMREGKLSDKSNLDFVVADFSDLKEVSCGIQ
ncbi:hypothetical protein WUBG_10682 [Wuchereria bancrofti]|uniref:Nudix hydrolase domain-containing protein n=1 Tax=Wuchereria bancrofti TaxID=6293 RepID=J9E8D5_WUCBA|nr:hypothetical protein WUBG_10682 [Wuchereria bancrofti]